jgi:hypothetical protein
MHDPYEELRMLNLKVAFVELKACNVRPFFAAGNVPLPR